MQAMSYDEFFAEPFEKGRFYWSGPGVSLFLQWGAERGQHVLLYMNHQRGNWAAPGDKSGWDGNLDSPTLSPSILVPGEWHGFLEQGTLRDA